MDKNLNISFIMFGFGLSYFFFGLSLIMPDLPDWGKPLTGYGAIFVGIIFFIFVLIASSGRGKKKTKK